MLYICFFSPFVLSLSLISSHAPVLLSSFRHFNQGFLITDTLGVTPRPFTCHLWEMEQEAEEVKTRSCVSHGGWNRPGNSTDMTPGTLLDCQLASPLVPAGFLLSTASMNGFIYFLLRLFRQKAEWGHGDLCSTAAWVAATELWKHLRGLAMHYTNTTERKYTICSID